MNIVRFEESPIPTFYSKTPDNCEYTFEYKPSLSGLWSNINPHDFTVELLINPYIDHEDDIFALQEVDSSGLNTRRGYVIPISVLDSEADFSDYPQIYNYIYIAYYILLERLDSFKTTTLFSDNFEDNISVCIFHNSVNIEHPLSKCIHSLRRYGYCYFEDNNSHIKSPCYDKSIYISSNQRNLHVKFVEPKLYSDSIVDSLLRDLPKINNIAHRFVILYQFIEFLMEKESNKNILTIINKYSKGDIPYNDFINDVKYLSSENTKIKMIFENCSITPSEFKIFRDKFDILCNCIGYNPNKSEPYEVFYSFRNQMTHSYRNLHKYKRELAETVQAFERIIMIIIERYN